VLALKDNHPQVLAEISAFLTDADQRGELTVWEETDKGHGRLERRRYCQSDQLAWFADRAKWEHLTSVLLVERTVQGETTSERHYYLSSLPVDPQRLAGFIRGHWSIENGLHWSLDVTFGEDRCLVADAITAQNLAALRKLALNTIKLDASCKDALKGKRLRAGWDEAYLAKLLGFHA
jgi:predicted transposase YbfD/YdcC